MAVNPAIALGVKGIELQDPLAQYGRVMAIQGAQQQNALAQLQMQQAQREQEATNALNRAYTEAYNPQTGDVDINRLRTSLASGGYGSKLPDIEKKLGEVKTQRLTQQKTEGEVLDAALKRSRGFLETLDPNAPGAADAYLAWHEANHKDPIIGPALAARGVTADQSRGRIAQLLNTPGGLARLINESKLGTEKFMELNKAQLSTKDIGGAVVDRTFEPLTGKVTEISRVQKTATPGEVMADARAREQMAQQERHFQIQQANPGKEIKETEQGIFAIDKKTGVATPVTMEGKPLQAGKALTEFQGKSTGFAVRAKEAHDILGAIDYSPAAVATKQSLETMRGVGGPLGAMANVAMSPQSQQADQAQRNFVNAVLRQESGAAISQSEFENARKQYFPQPGDSAQVVEQKRKNRESAIKSLEVSAGPGMRKVQSQSTAPAGAGGAKFLGFE